MYEKYEKEKKDLKAAIKLKEERAHRATKKPNQMSNSEARIRGAKPYYVKKQKKLHKTATAMEMRLESLETIEKFKNFHLLRWIYQMKTTLKIV